MKKRMTIMLIALTLVFGGLFGFNQFKKYKTAEFFSNFKMPPATISTTLAKTEDWQPTISAIGNFIAVNGVDVNAQQSGHINKIDFKSGQFVKKGKILVELDKNIDQANLADAKAKLALAGTNYSRQATLYKKEATPSSSLETAKADLIVAQAGVDKIKAIINQKTIRAPFDGKLGIRLVNIGQFISPGNVKIVTLQSQDPLLLQFYLPEHYLSQLKPQQEVLFRVRAYKNVYFKGSIAAINSKVESNTHNLLIQAQVANCPVISSNTLNHDLVNIYNETTSDSSIIQCNTARNAKNNVKQFSFIPGMFADIEVMQPLKKDVLVLPRTAVTYSLYGNSVYLVKEVEDPKTKQKSLKVFQQFIKIGDENNDKVVVLSGINKGDQVVNSGQLKLQNGTDVIVNNAIQLNKNTDMKTLSQ